MGDLGLSSASAEHSVGSRRSPPLAGVISLMTRPEGLLSEVYGCVPSSLSTIMFYIGERDGPLAEDPRVSLCLCVGLSYPEG